MMLLFTVLMSLSSFGDDARVIVASDFHLMHERPEHVNWRTFAQFTEMLARQAALTDLVINGDVFHGPTTAGLSDEQLIAHITGVLRQLQAKTAARIHFNLGNHDERWDAKFEHLNTDFSRALAAAVVETGISVIGTDPTKVYRVSIDGMDVMISHNPFARSTVTTEQSIRFRANDRAYRKVNGVELITLPDGVTRIMSDSHTPLTDPDLRVFNSGKLAFTTDLPEEPNTILIFNRDYCGRLLELPRES